MNRKTRTLIFATLVPLILAACGGLHPDGDSLPEFSSDPIRALTYDLRWTSEIWTERRAAVQTTIREEAPDIIGVRLPKSTPVEALALRAGDGGVDVHRELNVMLADYLQVSFGEMSVYVAWRRFEGAVKMSETDVPCLELLQRDALQIIEFCYAPKTDPQHPRLWVRADGVEETFSIAHRMDIWPTEAPGLWSIDGVTFFSYLPKAPSVRLRLTTRQAQ